MRKKESKPKIINSYKKVASPDKYMELKYKHSQMDGTLAENWNLTLIQCDSMIFTTQLTLWKIVFSQIT